MTGFLDDEDDEQPEKPAELSEEEAREKRYQEEAAQKLSKSTGLDDDMPRFRKRLAIGAAVAILLGGGSAVYAINKARGATTTERESLARKPSKPSGPPADMAGIGKLPPETTTAAATIPKDAYDQVDPNDPAFKEPVQALKTAGDDCPDWYSPERCENFKARLAGEGGSKLNTGTPPGYAANTHKAPADGNYETEDSSQLAPMGYFGVRRQTAVSVAPQQPEMAPMGVPAQGGLQVPPNLREALEKAAASQGPSDPDDVKEAFAARPGVLDGVEDERELGPCELTAGTVIHVANLSAINTDVPAKSTVTAQVVQTVYCGADNQHVAIPQGAVFTASANARVSYGDERIQLCMEQLKRPPSREHPNGSIVPVKCWAAADITGMVGWAGEVDNHWDKLIAGVALSTFLSLGTTSVAGNQEGFAPTIAQRAANNAGQQFNQAGQRIVNRDLQRKPTITLKMLQSGTVVVTENKPIVPWEARKARRWK